MKPRVHGIAMIIVSCLIACAAPVASVAGADTFNVDKQHSTVTFRIKHLNVSYFHGRFNDVSGSFTFDDDDISKSSLNIKVKTRSVDTNDRKRDKHLRSPDFFGAKQFPSIKFKGKQFSLGEDGRIAVTGDLTLHGVTKSITVHIERVGSGRGMRPGEVRSGFETTFTIKRTDFGMTKYVQKKMLGDEVRLTVGMEGIRKK